MRNDSEKRPRRELDLGLRTYNPAKTSLGHLRRNRQIRAFALHPLYIIDLKPPFQNHSKHFSTLPRLKRSDNKNRRIILSTNYEFKILRAAFSFQEKHVPLVWLDRGRSIYSPGQKSRDTFAEARRIRALPSPVPRIYC